MKRSKIKEAAELDEIMSTYQELESLFVAETATMLQITVRFVRSGGAIPDIVVSFVPDVEGPPSNQVPIRRAQMELVRQRLAAAIEQGIADTSARMKLIGMEDDA